METLLLIAVLVLPVVYLLGFAGCSSFSGEPAKPPDPTPVPTPDPPPPPTPQPPPAKTYEQIIREEPNLVSYWRLGELKPDTSVAKDSVPAPSQPLNGTYIDLREGITMKRGESGVLAQAAATPVDPADRAVEFLGATGFVEADYNALRNPPLTFSVEAWINTAEGQPNPQYVISSATVNGDGTLARGYVLDVAFNNNIRARARLGAAPGAQFQIEFNLKDPSIQQVIGNWWHLAMTYDGAARKLSLFVNGLLRITAVLPAGSNFAPAAAGTKLRIASGPAPGSTAFKGKIDEVALYNPPLAEATVQKHFNAALIKG
jgi:hypothetical protein